MRKSLPLLLLIFSLPIVLNGSGITNSFFIQTSQEVFNKGFKDTESLIKKSFSQLNFNGFERKNITSPGYNSENQIKKLVNSNSAEKLQIIKHTDIIEISNNPVSERKTELQKNPNFQKSNSETEFILKTPAWLIAFLGICVVYAILISLRFYKIYYQEVSTQEQMEIISSNFEEYKKNTIEKERKLLRELIDNKNKIQELQQELKKEIKIK